MARSVVSPLQLTTVAGLLQNQGLVSLPTALITAINSYNATTVITNWIAALNFYKSQSFFTETTFDLLLSVGSTVCPALGNSIPAAPVGTYTNLINEYLTPNSVTDQSTLDPSGFSWLIEQTGSAYLGDGDCGRFAQGFMAVQGYVTTVNDFINSSVNANEYLGPTFVSMDNLITDDIAAVNTNFPGFAADIANQGQLVSLQNLELYGTPAGVLQQFNRVANLAPGALPNSISSRLINAGLTNKNISDLVSNNRASLFNPNGLTTNEFDKLQKLAYLGMTQVTGDDLTQVLSILDVTTPNVNAMSDLLNPVVMFPNSYSTMQTASPDGAILIFNSNGNVNSSVKPVVNLYLPTNTGCDELGKIIPPADAVANKAIQVALQQIGGVANTNWPALADVIRYSNAEKWNINNEYLANSVVANGQPIPQNYLAVQDVPVGTDISNTAYWQPYTPCGLSTTAGLPLIQEQTTPVDTSVTDYFANSVATGSGPNGVITICDVIGLALDYNDFASRLNTATTAINALQTAGSLNTLNTAYTNILAAANDAAVLTQITNANNAISALSASPYVTTLNTAWTYMANIMNIQRGYQIAAGIDYFNLQAGDKTSIYSFVQNLPQYSQYRATCQAAEFLQDIADTTTLTGQAMVGSIREGCNNSRLNNTGLLATANQIPADPVVRPIPAVVPVS